MALTDGLIAYYKLDETSGTTAYDSVGSNDGTNNGATVNVAGKIDKAYDFDGTNDYINTGIYNEFTSSAWSVGVWIKTDSSGVKQRIIGDRDTSGNNEFSLYWDTTNEILSSIYWNSAYQASLRSSNTFSSGTWYYVVLTYDTNSAKLYVNGNLEDSDTSCVLRPSTPNRPTLIGQWSSGFGEFFNGKIDEVGIWSRALTSDEVTALYNSGSGLTYPFELGNTLNFNVVGGSGTIEKSPDKALYSNNEEVTITAIPTNSNYRFKDWSGDLVSSTNPETITMDVSKEIDVYFETRTIKPGVITF